MSCGFNYKARGRRVSREDGTLTKPNWSRANKLKALGHLFDIEAREYQPNPRYDHCICCNGPFGCWPHYSPCITHQALLFSEFRTKKDAIYMRQKTMRSLHNLWFLNPKFRKIYSIEEFLYHKEGGLARRDRKALLALKNKIDEEKRLRRYRPHPNISTGISTPSVSEDFDFALFP